jgi:hypothetical protein
MAAIRGSAAAGLGFRARRTQCWPSFVRRPCRARRIAAELTKIKSLVRTKSFDRFTELTGLKIQYSELVSRLSIELRLANQSRMSDRQAANDAQRPAMKPWDIGGGDGPTGGASNPVNWN